jgi:hypothetical protein
MVLSDSSHVTCPVRHLQEKLVLVSTANEVFKNERLPGGAMVGTDDTVSKEFPEFLEIIQNQGTSMLYDFLQIKKKLM